MRKFSYLLLCLILATGQLWAQNVTLSGKVLDEKGVPVPDVTVLVKGSKVGTKTDNTGSFTLQVPNSTKSLVFSAVGFGVITQDIGKNTSFSITLRSMESVLDEVVVTGYQTIRKKDLTSSATSVAGKEISDKPIGSFLQLLQGKSAGLQVTGASGRPGANAFIRIRGTGSINASSEPLIIADGIPITTAAYSLINPDDIEDVSVLKDAAATAIYGSRGSNGVIVVSTKKGKGATVVSYSFQYASSKALELQNLTLMNSMQKFQYEFDGGYYSGNGILDSMITNRIASGAFPAASTLASISADQRTALWTLAASRGVGDWRDYMLQTGIGKNHQLSVSGSSDKVKYYMSLNKSDNDGVTYGSYWNKIGGRFNIEYNAYNWLKIGTNLGLTTGRENSIRELYNGQAAYTAALLLNPYEPLRNNNGTYNYTSLGQNAMETTDNNPNDINRISSYSTLFAEVKMLKHLTLKSQLGINYNTLSQEYYLKPGSYLALTLGYNQKRDNGNRDFLYVFTNTANWAQSLGGKHSINLLAGTEFTKDKFYSYSLTSRNFPTSSVNTLENGGTPIAATTSRSDWSLISYFANATYDFGKKYFLNVSGRRDGSSRFGANVKFANFAAVGAAWDIRNEGFMDRVNVISSLKLRGSYGTTGNTSGIGNYAALGLYALNVNYNGQPASSPNQLANTDLTWEKNNNTDIGLDFGLFHDRLTGTIDLYNRKTKALLYPVNVSTTTGFTSYNGNIGGMRNKGYEISLSLDVIRKKDFVWNISGNYSNNDNEITDLYVNDVLNLNSGGLAYYKVGEAINTYKMVRYAGVNATTGKNEYYNIDGTKTSVYSSSQAVTLSGKSSQVKYFGSINTSFRYKEFDLGAQFYYSGGNYIMNYVYQTGVSDGESINNNQFTDALNYWRKAGDNAQFANLKDPTQNATYDIDRYLEKGDYITLRDLTIGYNLESRLASKLKIKGFRFFLQGTNLWLKTKYHGLPEAGESNGESTTVNPGVYTLYSYPQFKSVTVGANIKF